MAQPGPMERTQTPGVYRRGGSFVATWKESGHARKRAFPTYEAACAFKRDTVTPYRRRKARALPPSLMLPGRSATGWVYLVQSRGADQLVKVGWSGDVGARMASLLTAHPTGVDLVALLPGTRELERRLHGAWDHWRRNREWFAPEVLGELATMLAVAMPDMG